MSVEGGFKRIDLKVTANCCEGCKKKVKKALMSIDGVGEVTIHAAQPKVTVTSKADIGTLIKKLARLGKKAEEWPTATKDKKDKSSAEKSEASGSGGRDKGNGTDGGSKSKTTEKSKENGSGVSAEQDPNPKETTKNVNPPAEKNCTIIPGIVHEGSSIGTNWHYKMATPPMFSMPQYPIHANPAHQSYGSAGYQYSYEIPVSHQPPQPRPQSPTREDYYHGDDEVPICSVL